MLFQKRAGRWVSIVLAAMLLCACAPQGTAAVQGGAGSPAAATQAPDQEPGEVFFDGARFTATYEELRACLASILPHYGYSLGACTTDGYCPVERNGAGIGVTYCFDATSNMHQTMDGVQFVFQLDEMDDAHLEEASLLLGLLMDLLANGYSSKTEYGAAAGQDAAPSVHGVREETMEKARAFLKQIDGGLILRETVDGMTYVGYEGRGSPEKKTIWLTAFSSADSSPRMPAFTYLQSDDAPFEGSVDPGICALLMRGYVPLETFEEGKDYYYYGIHPYDTYVAALPGPIADNPTLDGADFGQPLSTIRYYKDHYILNNRVGYSIVKQTEEYDSLIVQSGIDEAGRKVFNFVAATFMHDFKVHYQDKQTSLQDTEETVATEAATVWENPATEWNPSEGVWLWYEKTPSGVACLMFEMPK